MNLAFFLRFRRVSLPVTAGIALGYQVYFSQVNDILYKVIVDRNVIKKARRMGYENYIQPQGSYKPRFHNYI